MLIRRHRAKVHGVRTAQGDLRVGGRCHEDDLVNACRRSGRDRGSTLNVHIIGDDRDRTVHRAHGRGVRGVERHECLSQIVVRVGIGGFEQHRSGTGHGDITQHLDAAVVIPDGDIASRAADAVDAINLRHSDVSAVRALFDEESIRVPVTNRGHIRHGCVDINRPTNRHRQVCHVDVIAADTGYLIRDVRCCLQVQ